LTSQERLLLKNRDNPRNPLGRASRRRKLVTSPDVASYAAMRHTGSITCAFATTPPASLGQLECGRMNRTLARAVRGVAHGATGAYVGSVLCLVTVGIIDSFVHPQGTEMLWTRESLSDLFLFSLGGIIVLGWWIVPLGVFFGVYFCPKLSQWLRKAAVLRGILLGAALGLLTAVFFALVSRHSTPTRTIQISFAFLPVYCAAWCGGYSWLRAKRV
jgi:hypothetical protein